MVSENIEPTSIKEEDGEFDSFNETSNEVIYKVTSQMDDENQSATHSPILSEQNPQILSSVPSMDVSEIDDPNVSSPFRELPTKSPVFMSTGKLRSVHREQRRDRIQTSMSGVLTDSDNSGDELNISDDFMSVPPPPVFEKVSPWRKNKVQSRNRSVLQLGNATLTSVGNDNNNDNNSGLGNFSDIFSSVHIHDEKSVTNLSEMENIQKELTNCKIQLRLQSELLRERFGEKAQLGLFEAFEQKFSANLAYSEKSSQEEAGKNKHMVNTQELQRQLEKEKRISNELRNQLEEFTAMVDELDNDTKKLYDERNLWDSDTSQLISRLITLVDDEQYKATLRQHLDTPFNVEKLTCIGNVVEAVLTLLKESNKNLSDETEKIKSNKENEFKGKEIDELKKQLTDYKALIEEQKVQYNQLELSFKEEVEKSRNLVSKLGALEDNLELRRGNETAAIDSHRHTSKELADLQEKHTELTTRLDSISASATSESKEFKKSGPSGGKINDALKAENTKLLEEVESLRLNYENLSNKLKDSNNKKLKLQELVNELTESKNSEGPTQGSTEDLKTRITELENELVQQSIIENSLISDKSKLQNELKRFKEQASFEHRELKQELDDLSQSFWEIDASYNKLLKRDIQLFTRLLGMYRHILDDESIKDTTSKVVQLAQRESLKLDSKEIQIIHESVSEYILLGTSTIVEAYMDEEKNNHSLSTFRDNDELTSKIEKLEQIIYRLRLENSELRNDTQDRPAPLTPSKISRINSSSSASSSSSTPQESLPMDTGSPRLRFRLDALTKRWKAAQETLLYERRESNRRLEQLSDENNNLRQLLRANNIPF